MDCSPPGSSSMGFSRQEYWSGLPFPSPGDLPNPGVEPGSPALQTDALPSETPGKPHRKTQFRLQFSWSVMSNSLWPHGLQHTRLPCPSPIPGACSNSCPSSQWCHPTISSSFVPFSSCLQSLPESVLVLTRADAKSWLFTSGAQSIGVSASHQTFQWIFKTDFL